MTAQVVLLGILAFCFGSFPFSLWIGQRFMGKDIREYGEGNPGSTNVFRAGGRFLGILSLTTDMAKGACFVAAANCVYHLPLEAVLIIGFCAILGSAFSPILHFKGGKSLAVTGGVLLALPGSELFFLALFLLGIGFLFIDRAAWVVVFSLSGLVFYVIALVKITALVAFMLCVSWIVTYKHRLELRHAPQLVNRPLRWLHSMS
jgi:glycerol-3-phosphate acyltransferase PlsY